MINRGPRGPVAPSGTGNTITYDSSMTKTDALLHRRWEARRSITDLEFVLDTVVGDDKHNIVTPATRLDLFNGRIVLVFDGPTYTPRIVPEPLEEFPHYPLRHFITYYTRIDYNIVFPEWRHEALPLPAPNDAVRFQLSRMIRRKTPEGHEYNDTEPCTITLTKQLFENFLRFHNEALYLAIVYYLVGCENPRYFRVEFFKAVEVIAHTFGWEQRAIAALQPHGVIEAEFKALKRYGNDELQPFNVGRHAPKPGVNLRLIDVRGLFEQTASREVFHRCIMVTRQAIDAYFSYLRSTRNR
jgi:hypothetical protein